jgi:uncharacterized protein (UPF0276 family)
MAAIQLGMTDCPLVRALLTAQQIDLDYLEVHGPYVENARQLYPLKPMLLHNSLYQWSLTHADGLKHKNADQVTLNRLAIADSPWYSLHLGFSSSEVDFIDEAMIAISPQQTRAFVYDQSCFVLKQLINLLDVPVLIENLDYNPTGAYEYVCETEFINQVLDKTGAYLLLDLAHAQVTAAAFGLDVREYLYQLPLDRVRQIHLNRPGYRDGRLVDSHLDLLEADYNLLEEILQKTSPWAVTLEYNRDANKAVDQIRRLREIVAA